MGAEQVHQLRIALNMVSMITRDQHGRMIIEFYATDEPVVTKLGISVMEIQHLWVSVVDEPALLINLSWED
jgi:hypothetical protein